jgi:hypothetical protein
MPIEELLENVVFSATYQDRMFGYAASVHRAARQLLEDRYGQTVLSEAVRLMHLRVMSARLRRAIEAEAARLVNSVLRIQLN